MAMPFCWFNSDSSIFVLTVHRQAPRSSCLVRLVLVLWCYWCYCYIMYSSWLSILKQKTYYRISLLYMHTVSSCTRCMFMWHVYHRDSPSPSRWQQSSTPQPLCYVGPPKRTVKLKPASSDSRSKSTQNVCSTSMSCGFLLHWLLGGQSLQ